MHQLPEKTAEKLLAHANQLIEIEETQTVNGIRDTLYIMYGDKDPVANQLMTDLSQLIND